MRRVALLLAVVLAAGCGGEARRAAPTRPTLPRALAQAWRHQADSVAAALGAGDRCTAERLATALRRSVLAAENAHRVPRALLEPLTSGVNALSAQITCTPTPATPGRGKGHGRGNGNGNGNGNEGD